MGWTTSVGVQVEDAELIERDRKKAQRLDERTVALQQLTGKVLEGGRRWESRALQYAHRIYIMINVYSWIN